MRTTNLIALGALVISVGSLLVTATHYVTLGFADLSDLSKRVGNPEDRSGVYGEIHKLSAIPVGTILPWIPTEEQPDVPEGWTVCDGTENTPDLSGFFLRGVTSRNESKKTGGDEQIPPDGMHDHGKRTGKVYSERITYSQGSDNNGVWFHHGHEIPAEEGHSHGGDNLPPYYNVIYIMKIR